MSIDKLKQLLAYLVLSLVLGMLAACSETGGKLIPLNAGPSPERIFAAEAQLVTFSEIQDHPEDFKDRMIRVTGNYFRAEPPLCFPYSGYGAKWMLVNEDLRLDAVGFEQLVHLIPNGSLVTVDGFFRLYEGPLGCGKDAPLTSAWYLETIEIVQPNPLVKALISPIDGGFSDISSTSTRPAGSTSVAPQTPQPVSETPAVTIVPTGTPTPLPTSTQVSTITRTPTGTRPSTGTPSVTPTLQGTSTMTVTPTRTPTASPTTTGTPATTPTSGVAPTQPPLPTTYPGATSTSGPPNPYP